MSAKGGLAGVALVGCAFALPASAGPELPNDVTVWLDLRAAYSDTGTEWLDGGLSKTRYGSRNQDGFDAEVADVSALWTPTFSENLSAHHHMQAGPDQNVDLGLVEGFFKYRILPINGWRMSARAGRFFPPVSLEHDGPGWSLTRTLTPSAINSWIGEEVGVVGAELRAAKRFGDHMIDLRGAAFGFNDTAGAVLVYRGWAQHDVKSVQNGKFALQDIPALSAPLIGQASVTEPGRELDDTLGVYGAANWRYTDQLTVSALVYDNAADPEVLENGQYGWNTRFLSLGAKHHVSDQFELIGQAMLGESEMGPLMWTNGTRAVDNVFSSAFLMGSWNRADGDILSARFDAFSVDDQTRQQSFTEERGWSLTSSWRRPLTRHVEVGAEILYIDHDRPIDPANGDQSGGVQAQWMLRAKF